MGQSKQLSFSNQNDSQEFSLSSYKICQIDHYKEVSKYVGPPRVKSRRRTQTMIIRPHKVIYENFRAIRFRLQKLWMFYGIRLLQEQKCFKLKVHNSIVLNRIRVIIMLEFSGNRAFPRPVSWPIITNTCQKKERQCFTYLICSLRLCKLNVQTSQNLQLVTSAKH